MNERYLNKWVNYGEIAKEFDDDPEQQELILKASRDAKAQLLNPGLTDSVDIFEARITQEERIEE